MYDHQQKAINEAIAELEALAKALRELDPNRWHAEAINERTARQIEQIARKLERGTDE